MIYVCALALLPSVITAADYPQKKPVAHVGMTIGIPGHSGEFYDRTSDNRTTTFSASLNGDLFLTRQIAIGVSSAINWSSGNDNNLNGARIGPRLALFPDAGSAKAFPYLSAAIRFGSLTKGYVWPDGTFTTEFQLQEYCVAAGIAVLMSKTLTLVLEIDFASQEFTHKDFEEKLAGRSIGFRVGLGAFSFRRRGI